MPTQLNVPLIKMLRLHFKMTQQDLARRAGVHENSINFLERRGKGTLFLANQLADVFECSAMQLMIDADINDQLTKNYALVKSMRYL
jgi:DNA-binding XRE family transcriptional regulator